MKNILFIIFSAIAIWSCKTDTATQSTEEVISTPVTPIQSSNDPLVNNTINLLQGTWRSLDDKHTSITFENNTRIETRSGQPQGKTRYFEIVDECKNDAAKDQKIVKSKARYISLQDIDICYFIKKITKDELILSYVGRNNTLRYTKSKITRKAVSKDGTHKIKSKASPEKKEIQNQ